MNRVFAATAALLFAATSFATTVTEFAKQPKYCLFVTVDGLDRDYVAKGATPVVSEWEKRGTVFPDAMNVYPTLTTANMTSLVTGAYPATTTIGSNTIFFKDTGKIVGGPRTNKAVTITEACTSAGMVTAAVQHFMLENRGTARYTHIKEGTSADITTTALSFLREQPTPHLLAVLYQTVDKYGHTDGAESERVLEETRETDAEIAKLLDAYNDMGILSQTLVIISSDHGMSHREKQIDVNAVKQQITAGGWKFQEIKGGVTPDKSVDFHYILLGNMQCYFNREFSQEERERLFAAIRSVEGIGTVFNETMMRRMHASPTAGDFIVEPAPGYWFGGGMGVHGRNTESDPYQMIFGAGVQPGGAVDGAMTIDLVPTALHLLGVPIPETVDGKVLHQALMK
jgi:hypothetical protein